MDLFQSIDLTVQRMPHVIKVRIYEKKLSPIFAGLVTTLTKQLKFFYIGHNIIVSSPRHHVLDL